MSQIANQWTGNGVANGDDVTSGNVNTTGNGMTVTRQVSGSPVMKYEGEGFRVTTTTSGDIARLDVTGLSGNAIRTQMRFTAVVPSSAQDFIQVRNSTAVMSSVFMNTDLRFQFNASGTSNTSSLAPAFASGDEGLIDHVVALGASPTASNGRIFYRITNLTNASWNGGVPFFYDTLYTTNVGTTTVNQARFGKISTGTLASPGILYQYPGYEIITVNPSDTNPAAAQAYFADPPSYVVQLAKPVVSLVSAVTPNITVSWPAVTNASAYTVEIASGLGATSGFSTVTTAATSPYTITGLVAGNYTVAVTATP